MKIRRMAAALMTAVFCCHAAACALKPIQNGGTSAEVTELPDEQTFDALSNEIFRVNRLDELYARHDSVSFLFKSDYSEFPEYYLWETPDVFYCEDSCGSKYCDRDDLFRQIAYDEQTGIFDMSCGVEFDSFGSQGYSFVPETVEEFYIKAHETPKGVVEKDGLIYMTTTADEELSGEIMERYGLEHSGQTVETTLVADAASMELQYYSITMISGDEEKLLDEVYFKYDEPAPVGYLNLRAAFEGGEGDKRTVTFVLGAGSGDETVKTMTVNRGFHSLIINGETPFVAFGDPELETIAGEDADGMSDRTVYIFTYPDNELLERYDEISQKSALSENGGDILSAVCAANSAEAVLARHSSVFCAVDGPYAINYSNYFDADGYCYEAYDGGDEAYFGTEGWICEESESGEKDLIYVFYAMSEDEAKAAVFSLYSNGVLDPDDGTEKVRDTVDNGDGTLTLTTVLSAEAADERTDFSAEGLPDELSGLPMICEYTLDAETLEILREEESLLRGEERIFLNGISPIYDAPRPEEIDNIFALGGERLASGSEGVKTISVIYDAGTEAEESFTLTINRNILVQYFMREGAVETSKEFEGDVDGTGDFTVRIFVESAPESEQ